MIIHNACSKKKAGHHERYSMMAIDCFAEKAVQTLGLAHVEAALEKGAAQATKKGMIHIGDGA